MIRIDQLKLSLDSAEELLPGMAAKILGIPADEIGECHIHKKAVDARRRQDVHFVYSIDVRVEGKEEKLLARCKNKNVSRVTEKRLELPVYPPFSLPPVVVGFGPAGMFAALYLARMGLHPLVLERGYPADQRKQAVEKFWQGGELNPENNVQFGEGGAGTFSDGKLTTGTKSPYIPYILQELADCGGGEDILYDAKPHIGTDRLVKVVSQLRRRVIDAGGQVLFRHRLTDIKIHKGRLQSLLVEHEGMTKEIPCSCCILALGHSASDTLEMLLAKGMLLQPKAFAMGVRIEHSQDFINKTQYGELAGHPSLPAADYKLVAHLPNGHTAYTFCMCPGGKVVAAAAQTGGIVTNGMSFAARDGDNANSALLVSVTPEDFYQSGTPLAGMYWQRAIEQKCFAATGGNYHAPAQMTADFLQGKMSSGFGSVSPSYEPAVQTAALDKLLPPLITEGLRQGIEFMDQRLQGFAGNDSILTGPETRSSSPVRMVRDENCQSLSLEGIFCCGEGAGYAGGIMSSAADGIRCALSAAKIMQKNG